MELVEVSKVLDSYRIIDMVEKTNFDLIFVSGLPSHNNNNQGGGVFRIKGNFENYELKKLYCSE